MLSSFSVWCKDIGPGIGGGLADRPDLLRFQSCISHLSFFFFNVLLRSVWGDSPAFV